MNLKKISKQKELTGNHTQQMLFTEELTMLKSIYPPNSTRQEIEHKFKNQIHEELKLCSVVSYVGNKIVVIYPALCHYEEFRAIEYAILRKLIENKGFEVDFVEHGSTIKRNERVLKTKLTELLHPSQRRTSKAYLVREFHKAICTWREQGYPHIIDTTHRLLQFWFEEDHFGHNAPFQFWLFLNPIHQGGQK